MYLQLVFILAEVKALCIKRSKYKPTGTNGEVTGAQKNP